MIAAIIVCLALLALVAYLKRRGTNRAWERIRRNHDSRN